MMAEEGRRRPLRLGLTLEPEEYERVAAFARRAGRPMATAAKRALLAAIESAGGPEPAAEALSQERERAQQLEAELRRLQVLVGKLRAAGRDGTDRRPRWEWPVERLLADGAWWDQGLPRLYELLGRELKLPSSSAAGAGGNVVDPRGYGDLMRYLFPPIPLAGDEVCDWSSPRYGEQARVRWENDERPTASYDIGADGKGERPRRAEVWEPVVRHVAKALCALETTAEAETDPYIRLRTEAEILGGWLRTLANLIGQEPEVHPHWIDQEIP